MHRPIIYENYSVAVSEYQPRFEHDFRKQEGNIYLRFKLNIR